MRILFLFLFFVLLSTNSYCQSNKIRPSASEQLIRIDTVQISPGIPRMVFKYFSSNEEYPDQQEKLFGRFEIYNLGASSPFQSDTLFGIQEVSYEDANFDRILDIRIVTFHSTSGSGDATSYYCYNPQSHRFEPSFGDLVNPSVNKEDSTITTGGYCCMGTSGSNETYKYIHGTLKLIEASGYSREGAWSKKLIGDSLMMVSMSSTTPRDNSESNRVFVDSTWQLLFGKLRIVSIYTKVAVDPSQKDNLKEEGEYTADVMGAFVYKTGELREYAKASDDSLLCTYTFTRAKGKDLVLINKSTKKIRD